MQFFRGPFWVHFGIHFGVIFGFIFGSVLGSIFDQILGSFSGRAQIKIWSFLMTRRNFYEKICMFSVTDFIHLACYFMSNSTLAF